MATQRRISGGLALAAAGLGAILPLAVAGSASAHVPSWTVSCDKISVNLTSYNADFHNTVKLTLGGKTLLDTTTFKVEFKKDFVVPAHDKTVTAVLEVVTDEDTKGDKGWTVTKTAQVAPCVTTPSPTPSHSASAGPSVTPTVKPSTSTPSPSHTGPVLASTGGGGSAPVLAAAGAGVIAIGGGLLFLARRRQINRH